VADPFLVIPILPGTIDLRFSPQTICALALVWGLALIHIRGVGPGRVVGNVLASLKVSALVLFVAFGFAIGEGNPSNILQFAPASPANWLLALIPVMFAYSGWNAASYIAEEIRDPGRNVPRSFALGTGAVVGLYLALNVLYLYVFPVEQLATIKGSVLDVVADGLIGPAAGHIMAVVAIISLSASNSAMTFAGPRVYFAMARDRIFVARAAEIHKVYGTPYVSILAQTAWSILLVLSGSFSQLITYTGFSVVLFSGIAGVALFVLRRRDPEERRPFKALGYPLMPGLFVLASALIVGNAIWRDPGPSAAGVAIISAGLPLYWYLRRRTH
jgi:APA family basic amino acid/polyamine antiporter